jgi:hypothetical protein
MTSPWSILGKYNCIRGSFVGLFEVVGEDVTGLEEGADVVGDLVLGALVGVLEVGTRVGEKNDIVGLFDTGEKVVGLTVTTVGESEGEEVGELEETVGVVLIVGLVEEVGLDVDGARVVVVGLDEGATVVVVGALLGNICE